MPLRVQSSRRQPRHDPRRGAVLIVALLFAALIAVALGSYLNLNLATSRLAHRTFHGYAALNLAEAGAEEAVWAFNRRTARDAAAWDGWSNNGISAWRKFSGFTFGGNTTGWVKVYVDRYDPGVNATPKVVTQASIGAPGDAAVGRMLEITLRRRSFFANGLVARQAVVFNGANATVDSWSSDPDGSAATAPVDYSAAVRTDRGTVASIAVASGAVLINQAHVWGTVATGGAQPQVGTLGTIRGADTPATVRIDPNRIATDFSADLPLVGAPVDGTPLRTVGATLGVAGTATKWRTPGIVLSGDETLTIRGDVTLVLTAGSGATAISVTGRASIIIPRGSSLTVYTEGDVKIAGRGLANNNVQPVSCTLWGTNRSSAGQAIEVKGNGALRSLVYAPEGDVTIVGNGDIMGAVVARNITLSGNAAFHYDEALGQLESNAPFGILKWRELSGAADRARYAEAFDGW